MDRRTFIGTFAGSLLAVPLIANAQQAGKMYRIGYLLDQGGEPILKPLWDAMREFGWVENQNMKIEPRYAVSKDQLELLAAELVQIKVDLITTSGTRAAQAAKLATKTIPIVFIVASDPVENGLVANLARPGGNLTGFVWGLYEEKLLEILKAALPGISRVAYPLSGRPEEAIQRAAKALGVQVNGIAVNGPKDFGPFYAAARKAGADAVVIQDVAWFVPHLEHIAAESAKSRLPAIGFRRIFAESGGLLSYGPTIQAAPRLAAQIDKVLKGAKPADLPVEQPTTFELVINMKTAKALGLTIPQSVLLRADEVIQ